MIIQTKDTNYSRDVTTGALLNTNSGAREENISRRNMSGKIKELETNISELQSDMGNIKDMLQELIDR